MPRQRRSIKLKGTFRAPARGTFAPGGKSTQKRRSNLRFENPLRAFTRRLSCLSLPRERCAMQISPKCCIVSAPLFAAAFALKYRAVRFFGYFLSEKKVTRRRQKNKKERKATGRTTPPSPTPAYQTHKRKKRPPPGGLFSSSINPLYVVRGSFAQGELEGAKPASNQIKCRAKPCLARRAWSEATIFVPQGGTKITTLF